MSKNQIATFISVGAALILGLSFVFCAEHSQRSVTCRHQMTGEVVFNGTLSNVRHGDNYVTGYLDGKRITVDGHCTTLVLE